MLLGLAFALLLVLTTLRFVEIDRPIPLALTSFSAYALFGYAVELVLLLLLAWGARRRVVPLSAAVVCLVLLLAHVFWVRSYFPADGPAHGDLRVMSANLEYGRGDASQVVQKAAGSGVLVLQEVTPAELAALQKAGIDLQLPFHAGRPDPGVRGTMVFSRYRLSDVQPVALGNGGLVVQVATPTPFRLYAVHTAMLLDAPRRWHDDLTLLRQRLAHDAARGPVIAVGDWNATYSHPPMRRILGVGMRDAAEEAGTWHPTWPTHWRKPWLRPVVAIDHVLLNDGFGAVSTSTVPIRHTDHLAVVAVLAQGSSAGKRVSQ